MAATKATADPATTVDMDGKQTTLQLCHQVNKGNQYHHYTLLLNPSQGIQQQQQQPQLQTWIKLRLEKKTSK